MISRWIVLGVAAGLLAGCAALKPPPPPPPPPPVMPAPPPPPGPGPRDHGPTAAPHADASPVATRLFANPAFVVPGDAGAVAVLVLPNDAALDPERAAAVCRAFVAVLAESGAVSRASPNRAQMVTIWPVTGDARPLQTAAAAAHDPAAIAWLCPRAVAAYDYLKASDWMAKGPPGFGRGRGPFLIAWAPAARAGDPRVPILTYDLSRIDTAANLVTAMKIWKDEIEGDPSLWQGGWNLTRWRLKTAATVDHFGAQIGAAIKLVPWLGAP